MKLSLAILATLMSSVAFASNSWKVCAQLYPYLQWIRHPLSKIFHGKIDSTLPMLYFTLPLYIFFSFIFSMNV